MVLNKNKMWSEITILMLFLWCHALPYMFMINKNTTAGMIKRVSPYFALILVAAAMLPYVAGLNGSFVFDDHKLIQKDSFYTTDSNPLHCFTRSFWKASSTQGLYRPVTLLSYWLDAKVFAKFANSGDNGLWSPGFRMVNLLLHILITLMIFKLALRLRFGRVTAFIASAIFALHPIHVEAVTPAFGRGELLCTLFLLAGLLLHSYRKKSAWYYTAAALMFMLSFLSKENGIIFLPTLLIIDFFSADSGWMLREKENNSGKYVNWRKLLPYFIYILPLAAVFLMRHHYLGSWLPQKSHSNPFIDNPLALSDFPHRLVSAIRVHGIALFKFFIPATLSCDYSYSRILPSKTIFDAYAWLTLSLFIAIPAIFATLFPHDRKKVAMLILLYVVAIIPAGNFIIPAGTVFAERLQYTPSIWLALFSAIVFMRISRFIRAPLPLIIFLAISAALFGRTMLRTLDWKNDYNLWSSAAITTPESLKVWNNYAVEVGYKKGDFQRGADACTIAVNIYPKYAKGYTNRGLCYAQMGRLKEAERDFRTAIKLYPDNKDANFNLGILLANKGKITEARRIWLRMHKLDPDSKRVNDALKKSANQK